MQEKSSTVRRRKEEPENAHKILFLAVSGTDIYICFSFLKNSIIKQKE